MPRPKGSKNKPKEQISEELQAKLDDKAENKELKKGHKALDDLIERAKEKGAFIEEIKT